MADRPGFHYLRVVSRTVRQVRADLYVMDIVCSNASVTAGAGGGGGDPDDFPLPPGVGNTSITQHKYSDTGTINLDDVPVDGDLLVAWVESRTAYPGITGWTTEASVREGNVGIGLARYGRLFSKVASGETGSYFVGFAQVGIVMEFPAGTTLEGIASITDQTGTAVVCGGAVTPSAPGAIVMGCALGGDFWSVGFTPGSGITELMDLGDVNGNPTAWVGYKNVSLPASTTIDATLVSSVPGQSEWWAGVTFALIPGTVPQPPSPGQWVMSETPTPAPDAVTTTFSTAWPFADRSLELNVDGSIQTGSIVSYDGAAGTFTLDFTPHVGETLRVRYQGR